MINIDNNFLKNMKLYHVKRKNFILNTIFLLNKLEEKYPELYKKYKETYNGREEMMNIIIPKMNCKFNDVIQMSPINPKIILDEMKKIGFKIDYEINIFEIESNMLNSNNLFIFKYKGGKVKFIDKEVIPFNENYFKNTELSEFTKEYYKECYKLGKNPLLFNGIDHIFYKGEINIDNLKILKIN